MPKPDLGGPTFLAAFLPFDAALDPLTNGGNVGQADWTDLPSVAVAVTVITVPVGRLKPTVTIWGQTPWSRGLVPDRVAQRVNLEPPRPLAKPATVQTRALRQRLDTDQFERRTNSRDVNPPQPLAKPARSTYQVLRQRLDTDAKQKPVARRITLIAAGRVPGRPTVVTTRSTWLYFVPAVVPRIVNRVLVVNVPRPLPPKTSGITGGGVLEGSAERVTNRVLVSRTQAVRAPRTLTTALRQRLNTDAFQKPVARRITLLPAPRLPKPATVTHRALRQRLDTDAFQKPVARRITINPARRLAAKPTVETTRPTWQYAPAAAPPDRWVNRVLVVRVPRPLPPKTSGASSGGILEGVAPGPDRVVQRVYTTRVRPPLATRPSKYRHFVYAEPQADGGLCLSVTLVQTPAKAQPPRVTIRAIPPQMRAVAVVVDRVTPRATRIAARPAPVVARSTYRALRQRLDTDQFQRRVVSRVAKPARPLAKAPVNEIVALRQRLDTDAFQRRVGPRVCLHPAQPLSKPARASYRALRQRLDSESAQRRVGPRVCVHAATPPVARARVTCVLHRRRLDTDAFQRHAAERFHLIRVPRPGPASRHNRAVLPQQLIPIPSVGLVQFDNRPFVPRTLSLTWRGRFRNQAAATRFDATRFDPHLETEPFVDTENTAFTGSH